MTRRRSLLYLLFLAYVPGVFFPFIDHFYRDRDPLVLWIYMVAWVIYVFLLLLIYYRVEEKG